MSIFGRNGFIQCCLGPESAYREVHITVGGKTALKARNIRERPGRALTKEIRRWAVFVDHKGSAGKPNDAMATTKKHMPVAEVSVVRGSCAVEVRGRQGQASAQRRRGAKKLMPSGVRGCPTDAAAGRSGLIRCLIRAALMTLTSPSSENSRS
jgi:hypothetical protein